MKVLLDTNILIYHVSGSPPATKFLNDTVANQTFCLSILSVIEFLGWQGHSEKMFMECKDLVGLATIFPINGVVAEKGIEIRRVRKMKLIDAVIASTALAHDLALATRNVRDFRGIKGLKVINPFE